MVLCNSETGKGFGPFSSVSVALGKGVSPRALLSVGYTFSRSSLPCLFSVSVFGSLGGRGLVSRVGH